MILRHVLAAALCASAAIPVCAQDITAQSLLDKNLEARGGAQALAAIFETFARVPAQVRPLPARLRKQHATIELWVPPHALDKAAWPPRP